MINCDYILENLDKLIPNPAEEKHIEYPFPPDKV